MPKADFGDTINIGGGQFMKLKSKGEKFTLRFAGGAVYEGKHFIKKDNGEYTVSYCPRIMNKEECSYCQRALEAKRAARQEEDEKKKEKLEKIFDSYKVSVAFYFPVLDRDTGQARVFETTVSVRTALEEEHNLGVNVLEQDYIVTRTEKPGNYYTVVRAPKNKKLSKDEKEELEKAQGFDIEEMLGHNVKESSFDLEKDIEEVFGEDKD